MLKDISSIAVLVTDSKKSAEWYRDKLGCEIVSQKGHWVAVRLPESRTVLHLCAKCDEWGNDAPGGETGIGYRSDNKEETFKELKARGVQFTEELHTEWFGTFAKFKDLDSNVFWL